MFKFVVVLALSVTCTSATPGAVVAAPYIAPGVVTAHSSQVIARNYNTLASQVFASAPYVAAPAVKAAPVVAAPYAAPIVKAAPLVASPFVSASFVKAAPLVASPYVAAPVPVAKVGRYVATPALAHYAAPVAHYRSAPAYYF